MYEHQTLVTQHGAVIAYTQLKSAHETATAELQAVASYLRVEGSPSTAGDLASSTVAPVEHVPSDLKTCLRNMDI
jgi:hypothetical protein